LQELALAGKAKREILMLMIATIINFILTLLVIVMVFLGALILLPEPALILIFAR